MLLVNPEWTMDEPMSSVSLVRENTKTIVEFSARSIFKWNLLISPQ